MLPGWQANVMQKTQMNLTCIEYLLAETSQNFRFIANPMRRMSHCLSRLHEL